MKITTALVFIYFFSLQLGWAQSLLTGVVFLANSQNSVVEGLEISAIGGGSTFSTKNGSFVLKFQNHNPGDQVYLTIGKVDAENREVELADINSLRSIRIPSKNNSTPIEIIVRDKANFETRVKSYESILYSETIKDFGEKIANLEATIKSGSSDVEIELTRELKKTTIERDSALIAASKAAAYIANINKDDALDIVVQALEEIETTKEVGNIDQKLSDQDLEEAKNLVLNQRKELDNSVRQVIEGYEFKINLLLAKYKIDDALIYYSEIVNFYSDLAIVSLHLAKTYEKMAYLEYRLEHFLKAYDLLQHSIEISKEILGPNHPDMAFAYSNLGFVQQLLGNYSKSIELQYKSLNLHPDSTNKAIGITYGNIANTYNDLGEFGKSLEFHLKSLDILQKHCDKNDPEIGIGYHNIAMTYYDLEKFESALQFQTKSIHLLANQFSKYDPDKGILFWNRARTLRRMGKYDDALIDSKEAQQIFNSKLPANHIYIEEINLLHFNILAEKGHHLFNQKKYEDAIIIYDDLLKLNESINIHNRLALCYYLLRKYDISIFHYELIQQIYNVNGDIHFFNNIGLAYLRGGKLDKAKASFDQYLVLNPNDGRPYRNLALYYSVLKDKEKSYRNLKLAVKFGFKINQGFHFEEDFDYLKGEEQFEKLMLKMKD